MQHVFPPYPGDPGGRAETVSVQAFPLPDGQRRFELASTMLQRDGGPQQRVIDERADAPRVHSGSLLFDALFALAVDDARLNSVDAIRDAAYNGGAPIACQAFQTGESWHYVWTRDLSYAVHLGLAWLDPPRCVTSLRFKTSGFRAGLPPVPGLPADSLQIVQDTGSGGSWPVSTDRVAWAWGAEAVLHVLAGKERADFARHALAALRGTLEADRIAAFDAAAGLYGGEQSFLDWRTQSYAPWIVDNLAHMAGAKALSTNVGHLQALRLAARLASELGDADSATRYAEWAAALQDAIDRVFWLPDVQQYASLASDDATPAPLHKFDLLGTALAVLSGAAPAGRGAEALARYPHAPFGAPVIAPQQPGVPVYHNRAIWPFVSAYALRAAAQVRNPAVAGHALDSLLRAAALNLSNMENLEWLSARPRFDDGPVINSRRQLWSVAACLGAVIESVFGLHADADGLRIDPFLTVQARRALGAAPTATLDGVPWRGCRLDVTLHLPPLPDEDAGYFPLRRVTLDGQLVTGLLRPGQLAPGAHRIALEFDALVAGDARITTVPAVPAPGRDDPRVVAPDVPADVQAARDGAGVVLRWTAPRGAHADLAYTVFRDGRPLVRGLAAPTWTDTAPVPDASHVYAVVAVDLAHGHHSHPSAPLRVDGTPPQQVQPGAWFTRTQAGPVGIEVLHDNHAFETCTGVTNAVLLLRVLDEAGQAHARGVVQLPHIEPRGGGHPVRASTMLRTRLPAGRFRAELQPYFNMSCLEANATYGGPGGMTGPLNEATVQALQIVTLPDA